MAGNERVAEALAPVFSPIPMPDPAVMGPLGLALSAALALTIAGPAGDAFPPLSLASLPIGSSLQHQNMACCAALPVGFAFSRLRTIPVGGF